VRRVVRHNGQTHPLNRGQATKTHDRLDEFNQQPEAEIDDHEKFEAIADGFGHVRAGHQHGTETGEHDHFIQLRGMPGDAVAEIHTPRQPGGNAVGLIFEARQKTPNPSDRDAEHQRQGEKVAGGDVYAPHPLDRLDGNQPADQATDDRLAAEEQLRLGPVVFQEERILEGREDATSGKSAEQRRTDHPPARAGINHISVLAAEASIEIKASRVGKTLEYPVWMDDQRPQVEVRRKGHTPQRKLGADTPRSLPRPELRLSCPIDPQSRAAVGATMSLRRPSALRPGVEMQDERTRYRSLALTGFLLLSGPIATRAQDPTTAPPLPPPGQLVDVGGWRLHLHCAGETRTSQPTVILEAGAGDFSVDWSLVQPRVARFARACSYDRAGSGWSDLGPRPRTMHQLVYELHTLLDKAGERPPYLLVGHSFGGALVRLYQSRYAAEVVGLVLVDAAADNPWRKTSDKGLVRSSDLATGKPIPEVKMSDPLRYSQIPERFVTMIKDQVPELSAHANDPPRDKLPADAQRMRTWSYAQVKMHISNDNPFEAEELGLLRAQRAHTDHVLGDLPLIVMSRGLPEDASPAGQKFEEEHNRDQAGLVTLSRVGKQVVARRSGHHIPLDEPDLVVAAIRDVLSAARR